MKNAAVITIDHKRFGVELHWVRDIFSLGHVSFAPKTPPCVVGVTAYHGEVVTVVDVLQLVGDVAAPRSTSPRPSALLVEAEGIRAALQVDTVDKVVTLRSHSPGAPVSDIHGQHIQLLDCAHTLADVRARVARIRDPRQPATRRLP